MHLVQRGTTKLSNTEEYIFGSLQLITMLVYCFHDTKAQQTSQISTQNTADYNVTGI